ncbi:MAG TPA: M14 family carboxypeptidase N/E [Spirochaetota bacterium]|nr:M14 family carboxypeptidase N/E [Spirochaetota bacterium]
MKMTGLYIQKIIPSAAFIIAFMLVLSSCESEPSGTESYVYYTIDEINRFIDDAHDAYPSITAIEQVGTSVDGKPISALVISSYSGTSTGPASLEMEPRVRISAGIHGNEKITTEVLLRFIDYLLTEYGNSNAEIMDLINSRYIVIIPVINPDGYINSRRYNSNGVDLNRNFSREWSDAYSIYGDYAFSEPESYAVSQYSISKRFTSGITLHSGEVIVNMPFDYGKESKGIFPAENTMVEYMGLVYAEAGTPAFYTNPDILTSTYVYHGTINGGDWYVITGSMQDWSYLDAGCLDYTVEIAESKYPVYPEDIEETYSYNRDSLVAFIKKSGYGVYGRVTDGADPANGIAGVKITIPGGDLVVYTDADGYYHRLLMPGTYDLTCDMPGYTPQTATITVPDTNSGIQLNVQLN